MKSRIRLAAPLTDLGYLMTLASQNGLRGILWKFEIDESELAKQEP